MSWSRDDLNGRRSELDAIAVRQRRATGRRFCRRQVIGPERLVDPVQLMIIVPVLGRIGEQIAFLGRRHDGGGVQQTCRAARLVAVVVSKQQLFHSRDTQLPQGVAAHSRRHNRSPAHGRHRARSHVDRSVVDQQMVGHGGDRAARRIGSPLTDKLLPRHAGQLSAAAEATVVLRNVRRDVVAARTRRHDVS